MRQRWRFVKVGKTSRNEGKGCRPDYFKTPVNIAQKDEARRSRRCTRLTNLSSTRKNFPESCSCLRQGWVHVGTLKSKGMVELDGILGSNLLGGQGSLVKDAIGSPEVVTMIVSSRCAQATLRNGIEFSENSRRLRAVGNIADRSAAGRLNYCATLISSC